jgi:aldose 1-epimerase
MIFKTLLRFAFSATILAIAFSCSQKTEQQNSTSVVIVDTLNTLSTTPFGQTEDGKPVTLYTLKNKNGVEMGVMNYGGIIVSLKVPDKNGKMEDVVLGFDSLSAYMRNNPFFGALIGRYGNRIAKGKFALDGVTYTLPVNNGENHLHGGPKGFDKAYWNIEVPADSSSLRLTYQSVDGEMGYPGNLSVEVLYSLTDADEVKIDYKATTDKKTVVNLTNHSYFNLTGDPAANDILNHQLQLEADNFLPVDKGLIPTGKLKPVVNTPFDFKSITPIGARIDKDDEQIKFGGGYDHCWVLNRYDSSLRQVATVIEPNSGRRMEVFTTEPGIQFYSGNFLNGTVAGKKGVLYKKRSALCLETQHYPDSPNKPSFPSVVLSPGETYKTTTVYKFSVIR